ncbi:MAG: Unknown protein [uncultured Thiotrichaceae bacterium]|uniref:Phytanoyl-CoA dioxygenase n=1 Tax=uncultured Thiotrichaceae bacterium TaxID=298394 RepID=A0A6S6TQZ4_9GAMM|nr:MAG: Unknown protein [uncultured Thiotrichaceae bacterium]
MNIQTLSVDYAIAGSLQKMAQNLDQWGCCVVRDFLQKQELEPVQQELIDLIDLLRKEAGLPPAKTSGHRFDQGFAELIERQPEYASVLFNASRRLTSVHQLSVAEKILHCSKQLMQTQLVMTSPYKTIRMDYQQRENYLLPWHQDYPYVQDSPDALIYWMPLHDVNEENGCMMVAPGSHRAGIIPVKMDEVNNLQLADKTVVDSYPHIRLPINEGDAIIFNSLLLHKSYPNLTPHPRWTLQLRYGNFSHPYALEKRWPCSHYEQQWFDEAHPEHVVD